MTAWVWSWCSHFGVSIGREHVPYVGSSCAWASPRPGSFWFSFQSGWGECRYLNQECSLTTVILFSSGPSWMRDLLKRSTTIIQLPAHPQKPPRGLGQWILPGPWLLDPFCSHCPTNPLPQKHLRTEVLSPRRYPVASICWSHVHSAAMKDQRYLAASSAS